jgi:hypothetical protein
MNPKSRILTVFFLAAGLLALPLTAHANGCTDICGPEGGCLARCLRVIQSMLVDIDGQVCKAYMKQPGQETLAVSCHNSVEQVAGRMLK